MCLNSIEIGTAAGSAPTFSASGEQVEHPSSGYCTYPIPAFTLGRKHHAQVLFGAFTVRGGDCHLKSANYSCSASVTKAEKEGVCLTHDIVEGRIECSVEILQTGDTAPVIEPGEGWVVTSPLACSNPDSDWPSHSATLTLYLAKAK